MRDLRMIVLGVLCAIPLTWSATWAAETRTEVVNQALASLLLGTLPLVGVMLLWTERLTMDHPDVRYGESRRRRAAHALFRATALVVGFAIVGSGLSIVVYRGAGDPLVFKDLIATIPVAFAGSLGLMAFLAWSRVWLGKPGLVVALLACWILGSVDLPVAAAVPTGHVRHLIGVGTELPFRGWVSFLTLYAIAIVGTLATLLRVPE